jgi:poly(hydroxyalkanoate) depolymerase family esterase
MLVVLLHGCTQDAADIGRGTRIAEHADREGFLALIPEQPPAANAMKCWNWYDAAHQRRDAGEPSLIAGATGQVMRDHAVDPARVHLAGISAGAAMASLVAVAYPERYASLALHSGLAWGAGTDLTTALGAMKQGAPDADALGAAAFEAMGARARGIPTLVIHGGKDAVVNPSNGRQGARQWAVTNARALGATLAEPTEASGEEAGYGWTRRCHLPAAGGGCVVEELVVHELGHAWSGGSAGGTYTDPRGPEATREIVRFFRAHPMAGRR